MTEKNYWYINKDYGDETDINKGLDWLLEMCKNIIAKNAFWLFIVIKISEV